MLNFAVIDSNWFQAIDWKTLIIGGLLVGLPLNLLSPLFQLLIAKGFGRSKTYFSKSRQKLAINDLKLIKQFKNGEKDVHLWATGLIMVQLVMAGLSLCLLIAMLLVPESFRPYDTLMNNLLLALFGICLLFTFLIAQGYHRIVKRYDDCEEFAKEVAGFLTLKSNASHE